MAVATIKGSKREFSRSRNFTPFYNMSGQSFLHLLSYKFAPVLQRYNLKKFEFTEFDVTSNKTELSGISAITNQSRVIQIKKDRLAEFGTRNNLREEEIKLI